MVNNVVIQKHTLKKAELVPPAESAVLVKDGLLLYDFEQNEPGVYKNAEDLYSDAITSGVR